jgi:hypothetical protein
MHPLIGFNLRENGRKAMSYSPQQASAQKKKRDLEREGVNPSENIRGFII